MGEEDVAGLAGDADFARSLAAQADKQRERRAKGDRAGRGETSRGTQVQGVSRSKVSF